jgi:hypothetical protein
METRKEEDRKNRIENFIHFEGARSSPLSVTGDPGALSGGF